MYNIYHSLFQPINAQAVIVVYHHVFTTYYIWGWIYQSYPKWESLNVLMHNFSYAMWCIAGLTDLCPSEQHLGYMRWIWQRTTHVHIVLYNCILYYVHVRSINFREEIYPHGLSHPLLIKGMIKRSTKQKLLRTKFPQLLRPTRLFLCSTRIKIPLQ